MNKKLKTIRLETGLKQYEAAKKLGITKDYLCKIENSRRSPSVKLIFKMGKVYNQCPEDIFLTLKRTKCSDEGTKCP